MGNASTCGWYSCQLITSFGWPKTVTFRALDFLQSSVPSPDQLLVDNPISRLQNRETNRNSQGHFKGFPPATPSHVICAWPINLRHCYQDGHKSAECPVCSQPLNELGSSLPFAHCAQSRLVCPISGHVMNENNPPMVLPNGYVYGENVSTVHA